MDFYEKIHHSLELVSQNLLLKTKRLLNKKTKSIIISGLVGGIGYASVMSGFDFADGQNFRIWRFIFNASFFGLFTGLSTRNNFKKQIKKDE